MLRSSCFALLVFVGCANQGDEGFYVVNNTAPPMGATGCTFTSDPAQPFLPFGTISNQSPNGYFFVPLLQSRVTALMGQESQRAIHVEGANVVLSTASPTGSLTQTAAYTVLTSGTLNPGSTLNVAFELIPAANIQAISTKTQLSASVTMFGTLGGSKIESEPFTYPVTVCTDCIIRSVGACSPATATPMNLGDPCNPFQDGIVDCCTSGTSLVCPASPTP
jgi:hypothetical protein